MDERGPEAVLAHVFTPSLLPPPHTQAKLQYGLSKQEVNALPFITCGSATFVVRAHAHGLAAARVGAEVTRLLLTDKEGEKARKQRNNAIKNQGVPEAAFHFVGFCSTKDPTQPLSDDRPGVNHYLYCQTCAGKLPKDTPDYKHRMVGTGCSVCAWMDDEDDFRYSHAHTTLHPYAVPLQCRAWEA